MSPRTVIDSVTQTGIEDLAAGVLEQLRADVAVSFFGVDEVTQAHLVASILRSALLEVEAAEIAIS